MSSSASRRFVVREAVLVTRGGRSAWNLTFSEQVDDGPGETVVVTVSPDRVDDMYFAKPYTRDEIEALARDDTPEG